MPAASLNGSNPLNVDPPNTAQDFADNFNVSAIYRLH